FQAQPESTICIELVTPDPEVHQELRVLRPRSGREGKSSSNSTYLTQMLQHPSARRTPPNLPRYGGLAQYKSPTSAGRASPTDQPFASGATRALLSGDAALLGVKVPNPVLWVRSDCLGRQPYTKPQG
ncbi:hypothetical protein CLAIMM_11291, partial [Cladophialophora immunda]